MATEYGSRLRFARKLRNMTQVDLSKATGIPQSTISTAEREGTKSLETITYATALKVRPEWLASGEDPMEPTGLLARASIGLVPDVTFQPYQDTIRDTAKIHSWYTEVPLLDRQSAGMHKSYTQEGKEPTRTYKHTGPVGPGTFAYLVDDDTMAPDFRIGTIAIIECDTPPQHGDVVLVQDSTGAYLRKLVLDGDLQYLETISGRLPARPLTATLIGWVSGEYHPRRSR